MWPQASSTTLDQLVRDNTSEKRLAKPVLGEGGGWDITVRVRRLVLRRDSLAATLVESFNIQANIMATVNFSVPDDIKEAFNREFAGHNKSAVIARLMRQAVAEAEQQREREAVFLELTAGRAERPALTDAQLRQAREHGRP